MKILHIDSEWDFRGGQQALLTLARGLRELGHTQTIACPAGSGLDQAARTDGFATIPFALRMKLPVVDVVHAHSGKAQNAAWLSTLGKPIKRVVTRHVAFKPKNALVHRWKYNRTCDGVIAVSNAAKEQLVASGVSAGKITVIPTGVELPATYERREHSGFVVGHLGAFTEEKGQGVAVRAALMIGEQLPGFRMILAGTGPLHEAVEISAKPSAAIELPGYIEDRTEFFAGLDLLIMPSLSEAWGLAALEAMAHGVPVVASETGGLGEIVENDVSGWLVPPGDARALAGAILYASSDRARLESMGVAGRKRAELFSTARTAEATERFYRALP